MRDRIYKAFHQDIEYADFSEIDKLKQQLDELKPYDDFVPYGLKATKKLSMSNSFMNQLQLRMKI